MELRFLLVFFLSPLFAALPARLNTLVPLKLPERVIAQRPHFTEGQLGQEISTLVGSHLESLKPYGIGVQDGAFVHLDLKNFSVIKPLQYAGGGELRQIIDNLKNFNSSSAASVAGRLNLSSSSKKSAEEYLASHAAVLRQLLAVHLDSLVLDQVRSSLSSGNNSWDW